MRKNQQGASYIATLITVIGIAVFLKIAIAVWGPYVDDRLIDTQITELMKDSPESTTPEQFAQQMSQRLEMNGVRDVKFNDIAQVTNANGLRVKKSMR